MNENHIEIKERRKDWLIKGITVLFLMLISLFIALLPLLLSLDASGANKVFYLIGGGAFIIFTSFFVYNLYKECNPNVALSLNAHGFVDSKNVGEGIEIEWTNVASVKILGRSDMPFLGIILENSDIVMAKMRKGLAEDMRENISENLPAILISQNEVRIPISELKEMFSKFVREARAIENNNSKKTKNNPFSTEDVLRAFGQLPQDGNDNASTIMAPDKESDIEPAKDTISKVDSDEYNTNSEDESDTVEIDFGSKSSNDSFYETLRGKASENLEGRADTEINTSTEEEKNEQISCEINNLLSKAKSSRISELGKLLTDTDTPFTYQHTDKQTDPVPAIDESSQNDESSDKSSAQSNDNLKNEIVIDSSVNQSSDENNSEITLDSMIENALQKQEETISKSESEARKKSEIPDLATLVSDLDKKVQNKKKNFTLQEKDESDS